MDQQSAVVFADNQGKYFDQYLEDQKILTLFDSGDKKEGLYKYLDMTPSFRTVIIQIGSNKAISNCLTTQVATRSLVSGPFRPYRKKQTIWNTVIHLMCIEFVKLLRRLADICRH